MSANVTVVVFDANVEQITAVLSKYDLALIANDSKFVIAGFSYRISTDQCYTAEEIKEITEEGYQYRKWMSHNGIQLRNSTYMGWSHYGSSRSLQFPIAHMLAQLLALYLNKETVVVNPQSGKDMYYKRFDHPEVHAVLEGTVDSFQTNDYKNFCLQREDEDGEWVFVNNRTIIK